MSPLSWQQWKFTSVWAQTCCPLQPNHTMFSICVTCPNASRVRTGWLCCWFFFKFPICVLICVSFSCNMQNIYEQGCNSLQDTIDKLLEQLTVTWMVYIHRCFILFRNYTHIHLMKWSSECFSKAYLHSVHMKLLPIISHIFNLPATVYFTMCLCAYMCMRMSRFTTCCFCATCVLEKHLSSWKV